MLKLCSSAGLKKERHAIGINPEKQLKEIMNL